MEIITDLYNVYCKLLNSHIDYNIFINLLSECTFGNKYLNKNYNKNYSVQFLGIDKDDDDYYFLSKKAISINNDLFDYIEYNCINVCNEIYAKRVIQNFTYDYLCAC